MLPPTETPDDLEPGQFLQYRLDFVAWYGSAARCGRIWSTEAAWRMCALAPHGDEQPCRYLDSAGRVVAVHDWDKEIRMPPPARDPDDTVYLHRPPKDDRTADELLDDIRRDLDQADEPEPDDDPPPAAPLLAVLFACAAGIIALVAWAVAAAVFALT